MSRRGSGRSKRDAGGRTGASPRGRGSTSPGRTVPGRRYHLPAGRGGWLGLALAAGALVLVGGVGLTLIGGQTTTAPRATSADQAIVRPNASEWTMITADHLATMLDRKDFTLLNVKAPYVGEIEGTDLYIPYDQLGRRAAELPGDRNAKIVVYCRSGHESAIAAQTLVDLGYSNIDNLDGGMTAWTASGRQLITVDRGGG